ncbi:hypothetical protein [Oceanithermus sp.]
MNRTVTRAFAGGILHGVMLQAATALTSPSTVLPAFIAHLTGSSVAVGGVMSALALGAALAGLPASSWVEATRRKKVFLYLAIWTRAGAFAVLAYLTARYAESDPGRVYTALVVFLGLFALAGGLGGVAYLPVIGKAIPPGLRGRFFGWRSLLGAVFAAAVGLLSRPLWTRFPDGYVLAFALALVRAPQMRGFLLAYLLTGLYYLALPFYVVAARENGLPASYIGLLVAAQALAEGLNLWIGRRMDERGSHVGLVYVGWLALAVPLSALLGAGLLGAVLTFVLVGVTLNGIENAYGAYLLSFTRPEQAATSTALMAITGAPRALWPLLGGWLASRFGYELIFALTALGLAAALLVARSLPPERREFGELH